MEITKMWLNGKKTMQEDHSNQEKTFHYDHVNVFYVALNVSVRRRKSCVEFSM